jgi:hypothetical protein
VQADRRHPGRLHRRYRGVPRRPAAPTSRSSSGATTASRRSPLRRARPPAVPSIGWARSSNEPAGSLVVATKELRPETRVRSTTWPRDVMDLTRPSSPPPSRSPTHGTHRQA